MILIAMRFRLSLSSCFASWAGSGTGGRAASRAGASGCQATWALTSGPAADPSPPGGAVVEAGAYARRRRARGAAAVEG